MDLLTVVIRASPTPLSPMLVTDAFPAVINCITKSDDHTVWQNGGECLRAYTSVAPDQVYEYRLHTFVLNMLQIYVLIIFEIGLYSTNESSTRFLHFGWGVA